MSKTPRYPNITDADLIAIRALDIQLKEFPDLFTRSECPYSPAIRQLLERLCPEVGGGGGGVAVGYDDDDTIAEVSALYSELKRVAFRAGSVTGGDTKDQMGVLKTASDLLTKMVDLKAKAFSVRDMSRFQKAVIDVLEGVITPAQRTEFIDKMGAYLNV